MPVSVRCTVCTRPKFVFQFLPFDSVQTGIPTRSPVYEYVRHSHPIRLEIFQSKPIIKNQCHVRCAPIIVAYIAAPTRTIQSHSDRCIPAALPKCPASVAKRTGSESILRVVCSVLTNRTLLLALKCMEDRL